MSLSIRYKRPFIYVRPSFYPSEAIRTVLGGRWQKGIGEWRLPDTVATYEGLQRLYPNASLNLPDTYYLEYGFKVDNTIPLNNDALPKWNLLYPFQQEAIDYLLSSPHKGSLLALSPGLGKTATSIVAANILQAKNVLVISPLSLVHTWKAEIQKWGNIEATICHKVEPESYIGWLVTNYNTAMYKMDILKNKWDVIIIDESVQVKNRQTKRFKRLKSISKAAKKVWLLSGSPTTRFADDLWAQFAIIQPEAFTAYWRFAKTYCILEETPWATKVVDTNPAIDVVKDHRDFMFVRHQKDVLPDLPEMIFKTIFVEPTRKQQRIHKELVETFIAELDGVELEAKNKVSMVTRLQQVISNLGNIEGFPRESAKLNTIVELLENGSVELPAIIWIHWSKSAEHLYKVLLEGGVDVALMTGKSEQWERDDAIGDFRNLKLEVLILSPGVGKYGLTLTEAKTAIYHDKTFDSDAYLQSLHRIHRIGLDHKPHVITLHSPGTVDDLVERNLEGKLRSISQITNADLQVLLSSLGGKRDW